MDCAIPSGVDCANMLVAAIDGRPPDSVTYLSLLSAYIVFDQVASIEASLL